MPFIPRTEEEIALSLAGRELAYTALTDIHEGGAEAERIGATAKALARTEQDMQVIANLGDLDRCQGVDLEERAAEVLPDGDLRQEATKASCTVYFNRAAGDTVGVTNIPAGQVVARSSDGFQYATDAATTVPDGATVSGNVSVTALRAGSVGNGGSIAIVKSPPARIVGVSMVVGTAISGGLDAEGDSSLRNRVRNKCRSLARCNRTAVEQGILAYTNGTGQRVRFIKTVQTPPRANIYVDDGTGGLDLFDTIAANEVLINSAQAGERVLFLSRQAVRDAPSQLRLTRGGVPFGLLIGRDYTVEHPWGQISLMTALHAADKVETLTDYTAYRGLIQDVQRLVDGDPYDYATTPGYAGTACALRVLPALPLPVLITLDVTFKDGLDATTMANAIATVQAAVAGYVNSLDVGAPLLLAGIIDVVMELTPIVANVRVVLPVADLYPAVHQAIRTTEATVTVI